MKKQVKNNVYWVGKVDWELKKFHGDEYSTHKGSTYNSYLIQEEKTVLVDTVWLPFAKEFVENLAKEVDLKKIDYIIANHGEVEIVRRAVDFISEYNARVKKPVITQMTYTSVNELYRITSAASVSISQ